MYNTPMAEITLTIIATYGTYIVADELFHVSAVLAVVTLGALGHVLSISDYRRWKCCLQYASSVPAWSSDAACITMQDATSKQHGRISKRCAAEAS